MVSDDLQVLRIEFQGTRQEVAMSHLNIPIQRSLFLRRESELAPEIRCETLGPGLPANTDLARFWDKVALTDDEDKAVGALNLIFGNKVERVAMVGDGAQLRFGGGGRRVVVKMLEESIPVPLKSLGDGAVRLFGVALALANSQDGFLVIDEAENGIHHSVQDSFWKMVMQTAHEKNVQVFVTTHGLDCVGGFARAASDLDEVGGALVRLERENGHINAVEYSEKNLQAATKYGIEVR
ncbi:MAG: ATP-binding protein [Acidimicrobiia bacterium]|nr:ATP-binding protein [Acidimicrobiia bacterium]